MDISLQATQILDRLGVDARFVDDGDLECRSPVDGSVVGDVDRDPVGAATLRPDLCGGGIHSVTAAGEDGNIPAAVGEFADDRPTESCAAAGDDGNLAVEQVRREDPRGHGRQANGGAVASRP